MVYEPPMEEHLLKEKWIYHYHFYYSYAGGFSWPLSYGAPAPIKPVENRVIYNLPLPPDDDDEEEEEEIDVVGLDDEEEVIGVVGQDDEEAEPRRGDGEGGFIWSVNNVIEHHDPPLPPDDQDGDQEVDVDGVHDEDVPQARSGPGDPSTSALSSSTRRREESDEERAPAKRPRWSEERD